MRWNLNSSSPRTIVWPALLPPWKRMTASARSASRSTTLPFPSSPHWAPTTAMPGIAQRSLGAVGAGPAPGGRDRLARLRRLRRRVRPHDDGVCDRDDLVDRKVRALGVLADRL